MFGSRKWNVCRGRRTIAAFGMLSLPHAGKIMSAARAATREMRNFTPINRNDMPGNYTYRYPHPAVTVDTVVFGWDGNMIKVLLVERGGEPYKGCYAVPGGFLVAESRCGEAYGESRRNKHQRCHCHIPHERDVTGTVRCRMSEKRDKERYNCGFRAHRTRCRRC